MNIFLSLIIPAYNESGRIERSLNSALDYLSGRGYEYEIIVVDDGSDDDTCERVLKYSSPVRLVSLKKNLGKGAAVRYGMLSSIGKYKVFSDADFSTPIYEVEKLLNYLESGYDICIGSRAIDANMIKVHQPFYREFMGKTFNKFVQLLLFKGISDTQCGFKGFNEASAKAIFEKTQINGFSFDVEVLYLAQKLNYKIKQVPVEWYNDERSTVNPITDAFKMFLELLKIRKIHKNTFK